MSLGKNNGKSKSGAVEHFGGDLCPTLNLKKCIFSNVPQNSVREHSANNDTDVLPLVTW